MIKIQAKRIGYRNNELPLQILLPVQSILVSFGLVEG